MFMYVYGQHCFKRAPTEQVHSNAFSINCRLNHSSASKMTREKNKSIRRDPFMYEKDG